MRILVTGGTGFIGSNIVRALIARGDEVVITGNDAEQKISELKGKALTSPLERIDWDSFGAVDAIFHEAANNDTQSMDEADMFRTNVDASLALFEYAAGTGCRRIVYASSTAVYGDGPAPYKEDQELKPLTPYGRSKKVLDEKAGDFAKAHPAMTIIGLRYCNVYGPGESHKGHRASMIYQLARQMQKGNPRLFKSGEQKRDFIYVDDVVSVNLRALEAKESVVVNCGSGTATSFNKIVELLNKALGTSRVPEYIENPYGSTYQNHTECDMSRAKEKLGFAPAFSIEKGIAAFVKSGALS